MKTEIKTETTLQLCVFPVLFLVFVFQVFASRGLFADGANFFLHLLTEQSMPWWDHQRLFNHLITKTPTHFLIQLGVHDIVFLRGFYSFWILWCPLLVWGAALWGLRRDILFWPFVMFFCFVYFSTCFFSIGEFNLCFALLGFCFSVLFRPLPRERFYRVALPVAAVFLLFDYPATLFSGGLLCLLVLTKAEEDWQGASRGYRRLLLVLFALAVVSSLWEVIAPRDPANMAGARNIVPLLQDRQFWIVLGYSVLAIGGFFVRPMWGRCLVAAGCVGLLVWLFFDPYRLFPFLHYAVRAYVSLAMAACFVGLWWFRARGAKHLRLRDVAAVYAPAVSGLSLLCTLAFFDIGMSLDYRQYLQAFKRQVTTHTGLLPYEMSNLPFTLDNYRFNWGWTNPLMSVVLREGPEQAVILNPSGYQGYQPFDPRTEIPDLTAYYR